MAWIRRLESGLWAATVRYGPDPNKDRITETRVLRDLVVSWAQEQEIAIRRGDWIDPRLGETTFGEIWERYAPDRQLEQASRKRDASHWRVHVGPYWAGRKVGATLKPDVSKWVKQMADRGVGAATIEGCVNLLRSLAEIAVDARMIRFNPVSGVSTPARPAHLDRVITPEEEAAILENLDVRLPGRPDARLFVETMFDTGLRFQEVGGFEREHVDMRRKAIAVGPVLLKDGTKKDHPKSKAGERIVPVGDELWPRLRDHVLTVRPGATVFTAPGGSNLLYDHWRDRVWVKGLHREVEMTPQEIDEWRAERLAAGARRAWRPRWVKEVPILELPLPTPHDVRHTFGTGLGEAGVPVHEIMDALGHANLASSQRYLHATENRFERIRSARKLRS